jgi:1-acyl-sn-glycerol-3-phosphate acyltransferase
MTKPSRRRRRAWAWGLASAAIRTFYRVDRTGEPLPDGALLLVANHPNTLIDPAVIKTTAGRDIRFLAKSTLCSRGPLNLLIRGSGAIPVYRRMDPGADTSRNVEMFSAVEAAFCHGEAICLFPEGINRDRGRSDLLRTRAARMELASTTQGHPVTIVPVGLNFERMASFRSRVTAVFGRPFDYDDLVRAYAYDKPRAVHDLTHRLSDNLRDVMVEASPRGDLNLVASVDRLYASARGVSTAPADRLIRRRLVSEGIDQLRRKDPMRLKSFQASLRRYDSNFERFGLRDRDVDHRITSGLAGRLVLREELLGLLLAPGLQSRATFQVLGGLMAYGAWISLISAFVWTQRRIEMALLAFAGLLAVGREASVLRTVNAFLALRQTPLKARARLKRQRAELASVREQIAEWVRDVRAQADPRHRQSPSPLDHTSDRA